MTDIILEPRGKSRSFTAELPIPFEMLSDTESTQTTRHEARAFGHLVASTVAANLPTDYHKRVLVDVSSTNLGLTPVLQLKLLGKTPPMRTELQELVNRAYAEVLGV